MREHLAEFQVVGMVMAAAIALTVAGCNLVLATPEPTLLPEAILTLAEQTVVSQLTLGAPGTQAPSPSDTASPSGTEILVFTDTPAAPATQSPNATLAATLASEPAPTLLFKDDFSSETGWYTSRGEDFGFEFTDGGYEIYVNMLDVPIWSIREREISDVILEVEAKKVSGADDAYFGVVCRHRDTDSYYALVISAGGTYGIAKSEAGEFKFLQTGTAPQGVIHSGEAVNRVRGWCISGGLTLAANDVILIEIADEDFESGYIGLIAGTRLSGGVRVLFDNFTVLQP